MEDSLAQEAQKMEKLLSGKSIDKIMRPTSNDVCIEFTDGTRFFVTAPNHSELDFSITRQSKMVKLLYDICWQNCRDKVAMILPLLFTALAIS